MKTIMIVDDELDILNQVKESLKDDDFRIITSDYSRMALQLIDEDEENKLGLILIDSPIPGTDKSALFSMKPGSKKDIDTTNEIDFLKKPFSKEELISFINKKF